MAWKHRQRHQGHTPQLEVSHSKRHKPPEKKPSCSSQAPFKQRYTCCSMAQVHDAVTSACEHQFAALANVVLLADCNWPSWASGGHSLCSPFYPQDGLGQ